MTPKLLKLIFVLIFVFQLIGLAVLVVLPEVTQAADPLIFKPQVPIPGFQTEANSVNMYGNDEGGYAIGGNSIGVLIKSLYKYAIGIVGILAAIIMMIGGFMWLMAAGNQQRISEAQEWIKASVTGLILALGSYMILATVSPALVEFKSLDIDKVKQAPESSLNQTSITTGCCEATKSCSATTKDTCAATWKSGYICNATTGKCEASSSIITLNYKECFDDSHCSQGYTCLGANKESGYKGKCIAKSKPATTCTAELNNICNSIGTVCVVIDGKAACPEPQNPISTTYTP